MIKNLILTCVSFLFALLLCEGVCRFMLYRTTPEGMVFDEDIIYTYRPNYTYGPITFNDIGCIGPDIRAPKQPGELRVFLLGGSTSFYVTYVETVQRMLNERYPEHTIKVVSCAKPRYTSYVNMVNLKKYLLQYEPDILVVYAGINDNIYNSFPWVEGVPDVGYFNWRSLRELMVLKLVKYYVVDKKFRSRPDFAEGELRSPAIMRSSLEEIIRTAQRRGMQVVLTTFALGYPPTDDVLRRRIAAEEPKMLHFWGTVKSTVMGVAAHNQVMRALAVRYGLPLIDNTDLLPRDSDHFIDICHFTDRGISLLAQHIARGIIGAQIIASGGSEQKQDE